MGAVWRARDEQLGRDVAIKVVLDGDEESVARFLREGQMAGALGSEHIVEVFDVGRLDDGTPFMVMELLDGVGFEQLVRRAPLEEARVCDLVIQACAGIAEAHARHIIHRDLKPSNLWMTERSDGSPLVKVLDFGLARSLTTLPEAGDAKSITRTGATLGTPGYMAPEQLRSARRADARSDIWALGHVIFRLLTGQRAFEAADEGEYYAMILTEAPSSPRKHRPDISVGLERVVLRCLQRIPDERYQDCGQLARALLPFASEASSLLVNNIGHKLSGAGVACTTVPPTTPLVSADDATLTKSQGEPPASEPSISSVPTQIVQPRRFRWTALAAGTLVALGAGVALLTSWPRAGGDDAPSPTAVNGMSPSGSLLSSAAPGSARAQQTQPRRVSIDLVITPAHAEVRIDGVLTRDNPLVVPADGRAHRIGLSAAGFVGETRKLVADRDRRLVWALRPVNPRRRPSAPRPRSRITPTPSPIGPSGTGPSAPPLLETKLE